MKYQVNDQFFFINKRGDHKPALVGSIITQKQYDTLTTQKKAKCSPVIVSPNGRVRYTREENIQLVLLYLQNDNVAWVRDTFMINNPDTLHTVDSINAQVGQLRTLDINYPNDTRWAVKNLTEEVATDIAPERFGTYEDMKALALQNQAEAILAELVG